VKVPRQLEDELPGLVEQVLRLLGEDPGREGLVRTPDRVARSLRSLTDGYRTDAREAIGQALFEDDYDEVVVVRDIPFYSLCLPADQRVDAIDGPRPAGRVGVGDRLLTLAGGQIGTTEVAAVTRRWARCLVRVQTARGGWLSTPDHPFATPEGWVEAQDLAGRLVEWADPDRGRPAPALAAPAARAVGDPAWEARHGFPAAHTTSLQQSEWVPVREVEVVEATREPFEVCAFTCHPHPTFLVGGHLAHNCEHHLLPFFGAAHVAYLPRGRVVGLSKIPRLVDVFAHRLQLQERMTRQIAEGLEEVTQPAGVAVVVEARHLCMEMRGVEKPGSQTVTSCMLGCFRDDARSRAEVLQLLRDHR
jgi:GTP cyclohydrolase I